MKNQNPSHSVYDITIRLIILLLIIICSLMIMAPFANIILWSMILAVAFNTLHSNLSNKLGGRPRWASVIIVGAILVIIIYPTGLLVSSFTTEVKDLRNTYTNEGFKIPSPDEKVKNWPIIGNKLYTNWQEVSSDTSGFMGKHQDELIGIVETVAKGFLGAVSGIIQIVVSLIIAGVLLTYKESAEGIRMFFRKVGGDRGDEFAILTSKTITSVVKGIIGEGLILALLHGVVFMLAGVPYAGVWTLLIFVFAIMQLPVFAITIPIMIYFFNVHDTLPAVLWSVFLLLVTLSDNVLTPLLLGKGAPVPMVVMFIGVLGGFVLFGFIGLFTGAIVLALGYNLLMGWINNEENELPMAE